MFRDFPKGTTLNHSNFHGAWNFPSSTIIRAWNFPAGMVRYRIADFTYLSTSTCWRKPEIARKKQPIDVIDQLDQQLWQVFFVETWKVGKLQSGFPDVGHTAAAGWCSPSCPMSLLVESIFKSNKSNKADQFTQKSHQNSKKSAVFVGKIGTIVQSFYNSPSSSRNHLRSRLSPRHVLFVERRTQESDDGMDVMSSVVPNPAPCPGGGGINSSWENPLELSENNTNVVMCVFSWEKPWKIDCAHDYSWVLESFLFHCHVWFPEARGENGACPRGYTKHAAISAWKCWVDFLKVAVWIHRGGQCSASPMVSATFKWLPWLQTLSYRRNTNSCFWGRAT